MKGCLTCQYFEWKDEVFPICQAFPNGIPVVFTSGQFLHDKVVEGQVGDFVWTKKELTNAS